MSSIEIDDADLSAIDRYYNQIDELLNSDLDSQQLLEEVHKLGLLIIHGQNNEVKKYGTFLDLVNKTKNKEHVGNFTAMPNILGKLGGAGVSLLAGTIAGRVGKPSLEPVISKMGNPAVDGLGQIGQTYYESRKASTQFELSGGQQKRQSLDNDSQQSGQKEEELKQALNGLSEKVKQLIERILS